MSYINSLDFFHKARAQAATCHKSFWWATDAILWTSPFRFLDVRVVWYDGVSTTFSEIQISDLIDVEYGFGRKFLYDADNRETGCQFQFGKKTLLIQEGWLDGIICFAPSGESEQPKRLTLQNYFCPYDHTSNYHIEKDHTTIDVFYGLFSLSSVVHMKLWKYNASATEKFCTSVYPIINQEIQPNPIAELLIEYEGNHKTIEMHPSIRLDLLYLYPNQNFLKKSMCQFIVLRQPTGRFRWDYIFSDCFTKTDW